MANILYAKTGLKIPKTMFGRDGFNKGFDDDIRFLINVSYNNPEDNFYIIGNNAFDKITPKDKNKFFPHDNVFDAFDFSKREEAERYMIPLEYLNDNNIVVDYGIIALGPVLDRNIPYASKLPNGEWAKPLARGKNYIAPVIHTLNETGVKWVALCDDPRCLKGAYDWFNTPPIVLCQIDGTMPVEHITSYDDLTLITSEIEVKYAHVESAVVMDEKVHYVDDSWSTRTNNFSVALNGGNHKEGLNWEKNRFGFGGRADSRYGTLKEWVLDSFADCEVFGKWGEDVLESDERFMGSVARSKLYKLMLNWKHSLCIAIKSGWATSKYLEYLKCGVSPFLYPTYDNKDDKKNTKLQDFYRVESTDDLKERVLLDDVIHIRELNKAIDSCLADEFTSGQYLNDEVYHYLGIERNITNVNRELWEVEPGSETKGVTDFFE